MNLASKVHVSSIFSRTRNWDLIIQWCHHFMTHALGPVLGLEVVEWQLDSVHLLRQKRAHPSNNWDVLSQTKNSVMRCSLPMHNRRRKMKFLQFLRKWQSQKDAMVLPTYQWRIDGRCTKSVSSTIPIYTALRTCCKIGCHDQWLSNGWSMRYPNCGA